MIEVGIKGKKSVVVSEEMTAERMGSGLVRVYATPMMVALMEETCSESVAVVLGEGECTVGTRLEINHTAATAVGMEVWCESELVEVDGRRLRFDVRAYDEGGEIGNGVHERFVVDKKRFEEKANMRGENAKKAKV